MKIKILRSFYVLNLNFLAIHLITPTAILFKIPQKIANGKFETEKFSNKQKYQSGLVKLQNVSPRHLQV